MMWVPWRPGSTAQEQARIRAGRAERGRVKAAVARGQAVQKHRQLLFRQLKQGKITRAQYLQALRKLERG